MFGGLFWLIALLVVLVIGGFGPWRQSVARARQRGRLEAGGPRDAAR